MSEAVAIPDFQNAYDMPIEDIDVSDPMMFKAKTRWP